MKDWREIVLPLSPTPLEAGRFLERPNRFLAYVLRERDGKPLACHLPNPGRLKEVLRPGERVWIAPALREGGRKTTHQIVLFQSDGLLVLVDNRLANRLVAATFQETGLPPWGSYRLAEQEVSFSHSRLDFLLKAPEEPPLLLEVKSCTLVVGEEARFPDAPTERGRRHLEALMRWMEKGGRAGVLFVIQRADARRFAPSDDTDPAFGRTFRAALERGLEAVAWTTWVDRKRWRMRWWRRVEVRPYPS